MRHCAQTASLLSSAHDVVSTNDVVALVMRSKADAEGTCSMSAICMCKDLAKTACVDKPDSNRVQGTDILFQDIILYRKLRYTYSG